MRQLRAAPCPPAAPSAHRRRRRCACLRLPFAGAMQPFFSVTLFTGQQLILEAIQRWLQRPCADDAAARQRRLGLKVSGCGRAWPC